MSFNLSAIAGTAALVFAASTYAAETHYEVTDPEKPYAFAYDQGKMSLRVNGQVMHLAGGTVSTWVGYTLEGIYKVGVTLSENTLDLQQLPAEGEHHDAHIQLPVLPGSPYTHLYFAWNPAGHAPDSVYNISHYDFHFSFVDSDYLSSIEFADPEGQILPEDGFLPDSTIPQQFPDGSYINVPGQGVHWYYDDAPEWNGGVFTETYLWGSYDGNSLFMEPMVTYDTMMANDSFEKTVELPRCFQKAGFYAKSYGWHHTTDRRGNKTVEVYLSNFEYHEKTTGVCNL